MSFARVEATRIREEGLSFPLQGVEAFSFLDSLTIPQSLHS